MTGADNPVSTRRLNLMGPACGCFAVWTVAAILSDRCLYADGAHEFVKILQTQGFFSTMWSRHFAFFIYELPLVLAIKLGVTHLGWLRLAFGLGRFLPWPLALLGCRWLSPKHFWLAVIGCAAGYLNTVFGADGAHNLAHALFWPALFAILFANPLPPVGVVLLLGSATVLLFSYESQLFLCLPLAWLAGWRARREILAGHRVWVVFLTAATLFCAGVAIGLCSVLMPEIPASFKGFKGSTWHLLGHMGWTLSWTIIWAALGLFVLCSEKFRRVTARQPALYPLFTGILVWGTWPILAPDQLDNGIQYDNRVLDLLVPLALLPLALILRLRPEWIEPGRKQIVQWSAALLIAQSLWQISATVCWYEDVLRMQGILASRQGIVPMRSTVLGKDGMEGRELYPDALGGRFDWAWPCLSIALAPGKQINCLICSEVFLDPTIRRQCWQPFDPFRPETLPPLGRYGLNYSNYLAALNGPDLK